MTDVNHMFHVSTNLDMDVISGITSFVPTYVHNTGRNVEWQRLLSSLKSQPCWSNMTVNDRSYFSGEWLETVIIRNRQHQHLRAALQHIELTPLLQRTMGPPPSPPNLTQPARPILPTTGAPREDPTRPPSPPVLNPLMDFSPEDLELQPVIVQLVKSRLGGGATKISYQELATHIMRSSVWAKYQHAYTPRGPPPPGNVQWLNHFFMRTATHPDMADCIINIVDVPLPVQTVFKKAVPIKHPKLVPVTPPVAPPDTAAAPTAGILDTPPPPPAAAATTTMRAALPPPMPPIACKAVLQTNKTDCAIQSNATLPPPPVAATGPLLQQQQQQGILNDPIPNDIVNTCTIIPPNTPNCVPTPQQSGSGPQPPPPPPAPWIHQQTHNHVRPPHFPPTHQMHTGIPPWMDNQSIFPTPPPPSHVHPHHHPHHHHHHQQGGILNDPILNPNSCTPTQQLHTPQSDSGVQPPWMQHSQHHTSPTGGAHLHHKPGILGDAIPLNTTNPDACAPNHLFPTPQNDRPIAWRDNQTNTHRSAQSHPTPPPRHQRPRDNQPILSHSPPNHDGSSSVNNKSHIPIFSKRKREDTPPPPQQQPQPQQPRPQPIPRPPSSSSATVDRVTFRKRQRQNDDNDYVNNRHMPSNAQHQQVNSRREGTPIFCDDEASVCGFRTQQFNLDTASQEEEEVTPQHIWEEPRTVGSSRDTATTSATTPILSRPGKGEATTKSQEYSLDEYEPSPIDEYDIEDVVDPQLSNNQVPHHQNPDDHISNDQHAILQHVSITDTKGPQHTQLQEYSLDDYEDNNTTTATRKGEYSLDDYEKPHHSPKQSGLYSLDAYESNEYNPDQCSDEGPAAVSSAILDERPTTTTRTPTDSAHTTNQRVDALYRSLNPRSSSGGSDDPPTEHNNNNNNNHHNNHSSSTTPILPNSSVDNPIMCCAMPPPPPSTIDNPIMSTPPTPHPSMDTTPIMWPPTTPDNPIMSAPTVDNPIISAPTGENRIGGSSSPHHLLIPVSHAQMDKRTKPLLNGAHQKGFYNQPEQNQENRFDHTNRHHKATPHCRYFLLGRCQAAQCEYLHDAVHVAEKQALCKYLERGRCSKGDTCTFRHTSLSNPKELHRLTQAIVHASARQFPIENPQEETEHSKTQTAEHEWHATNRVAILQQGNTEPLQIETPTPSVILINAPKKRNHHSSSNSNALKWNRGNGWSK